MAPTFRHGKDAYFAIVIPAGSTVNLSSGLDDVSLSRSVNSAETTVYGLGDRRHIPGLREGTFDFAGHFSSTHEEKLIAALGSTGYGVRYGPAGNTAGRRKYSASVVITSLDVSSPVDDKVSISGTFLVTGAVTSTTF